MRKAFLLSLDAILAATPATLAPGAQTIITASCSTTAGASYTVDIKINYDVVGGLTGFTDTGTITGTTTPT
jgi:hypothetical protein